MKKLLILSMMILSISSIKSFAQSNQNSEESDKIQKEWEEIGEQGKRALSEAGKFFSNAGKKVISDTGKIINDSIKEMKTPQCYGKWIYKTEKSRTIIECKENGQMTIQQKSHGKTVKWSGVFTATAHTITFKIVKTRGKTTQVEESWFINYSLQEGGETIKIQSMNIPEDEYGVNFRSAVLFEKYRLFV